MWAGLGHNHSRPMGDSVQADGFHTMIHATVHESLQLEGNSWNM